MFDTLNAEQRAAATHDGGPLLVLAGAGTGKTTTLTARVAWLLDQGVPGERILLLTFTRRAARQMLSRAEAHARRGGRRARAGWGGTFHSVAHRILSGHTAALGLPAHYAVLDPSDAADLIDLVREEHGFARAGRRMPRKATLLDIYSRTVNTQRPLSETVAESYPWCDDLVEPLAALFRAYVARKRQHGLLDFDDLLLHWRALVRHDIVGPQLAGLFDHVLVDEYQDVNDLQADIVAALRPSGDGLTVVGDDAQAIYAFRGASPRHILDVPRRYPGTTIVRLERSYRAPQPLLDLANAVWAGAHERFDKTLRAAPSRTASTRPELVLCDDELDQAEQVCRRVLDARERGLLLRRQAVLFRAARHGDLLELELARRGIPYVKYGGLRFLEAAHVKDLLAVFRLADNPADEVAWFRVLQLLDGVGPVVARRVTDALRLDGDAPLSRWDDAAALLPAGARPGAAAVVAALRGAPPTLPARDRAESLRAAVAPLVEATYADAGARLADLDRLVTAAGEARDLRTFVVDLALDPPASTGAEAVPPHLDEDYLVLSTVHSAKGLEWEAVHVLHATDGSFPSDMALTSATGLDEERRLFYVALTRARSALHLYAPLRYHHHPRARDDRHSWAQRSRFLDDAAVQCCDLVEPTRAGPSYAGAVAGVAAQVEVDLDALWA